MFNKDPRSMASNSNNETIIAQGVMVEGDFTSQGDVVIDGEVKGSVQTAQTLRIGDSAKIHADVTANTAIVAGEVQGNIRITDRLELLESSRVHGDIEASVLSIAAGANVNGRITMNGGAKAAKPNKEPKEEQE